MGNGWKLSNSTQSGLGDENRGGREGEGGREEGGRGTPYSVISWRGYWGILTVLFLGGDIGGFLPFSKDTWGMASSAVDTLVKYCLIDMTELNDLFTFLALYIGWYFNGLRVCYIFVIMVLIKKLTSTCDTVL